MVLQALPFWSQARAIATADEQSVPVNLRSWKASGTVQGAEPPLVVVVCAGFFLPPPAVVVVAAVVLGIGEVGDWMEPWLGVPAVLLSPLESEPHPAPAAISAPAPSSARS